MVSGEQNLPLWVVSEFTQPSEEAIELSLVRAVGQTLNVLQNERLRSGIAHDAHILIQQRRIGVAALALLFQPEPGLAEGCARWTADNEDRFTRSQAGCCQHVLSRNLPNVTAHRGSVIEVGLERPKRRLVVVGGDRDAKQTTAMIVRRELLRICTLDGKIEPTRSREQTHYREPLRHLPPQILLAPAIHDGCASTSIVNRSLAQTPDMPAIMGKVCGYCGHEGDAVDQKSVAGRAFGQIYRVQGRADLHKFLLNAIQAAGGRVLYASDPDRAPVYLGVQLDSDERIGMLVYPFRITRNAIKNRPDDEVRGQLRYGSEESWTHAHPIARDTAGVDVTMVIGIDVAEGVMLGLDANLWDPLPMGISFYAKDADIQEARHSGWHVWEKVNRGGTRRSAPRSPTSLETVVAFTPDRLITYARLERRATSLRLDPPLRFSTALAMAASAETDVSPRHVLEEQFALTSEQILDIIGGRNRLSVAVRGGVAEYHLEKQLRGAPGVLAVARLDVDAMHDFNVSLEGGRALRVECKNASPNAYANGALKVEVQKTRASLGDPASRFYPVDGFDVVAACLYSPTGRWEFRFGRTSRMTRHKDFPDRLAPIQVITADWTDSVVDIHE